MSDQTQTTNNDFSGGFLVKDASGEFKKVDGDAAFDLSETPQPAKPQTTPTPAAKPVTPIASPPPPPPSPASQPTAPKVTPFLGNEDEEEIKKHADQLKKMVAQSQPTAPGAVDAIVQKVIDQNDIQFSDEIMRKRFAKILESRLREIRNSIETADVLQRQKKIGGLELPPEQVEKIIAAVDAEAAGFHQKKKPTPPAPPPIPKKEEPISSGQEKGLFPDAPPAFVPRPGGAAPTPTKPSDEQPEELAKEIQKELEAMQQPQPPTSPTPEPTQKIEVEVATPEPQRPVIDPKPAMADHELYGQPTEEMPRIIPAQPQEASREAVVDIKQPSHVVGPVEEIRRIDLKEFRRLGSNPEEAAEHISEKIDLLEEESWQMRMDGINAWRQSPLYALYLEIGQNSIESGSGVQDIINTRQQKGEPHLLMEEFLALNFLNGTITI